MTISTIRIVGSFTVAALLVLGLLIISSPTVATTQAPPDCFGDLVYQTCFANKCVGAEVTCAWVPCQVCNEFGCSYLRAECLGKYSP